jgi:hypothetical protein
MHPDRSQDPNVSNTTCSKHYYVLRISVPPITCHRRSNFEVDLEVNLEVNTVVNPETCLLLLFFEFQKWRHTYNSNLSPKPSNLDVNLEVNTEVNSAFTIITIQFGGQYGSQYGSQFCLHYYFIITML